MEGDVLWYRDIEKGGFPLLGQKSRAIAILHANEFSVPHGFIVPVKFFNRFLEKSGIKDNIAILMKNISPDDADGIQARANEVQRLIMSTEVSQELRGPIIEAYKSLDIDEKKVKDILRATARDVLVAVRSDPMPHYNDPSVRDVHMTFLNIKGEKMLLRTIQACWASLYMAKAVEYRAKKGLSQVFCSMSVVIQRMMPARKSGILLTTNPTNKYSSVIEACMGTMRNPEGKKAEMSKYIVNTQIMDVTNDDIKRQEVRFVYDEDDSTYLEEDIRLLPNKKPIENSEVIELAKLGKKIEDVFGRPQEVEWIYYNKFYFMNSRPLEPEAKIEPEPIHAEKKEDEFIEIKALLPTAQEFASQVEEPQVEEKHEEVDVYLDEKKEKIVVEHKIDEGDKVREQQFKLDPHRFIADSKKTMYATIPVIHAAVEAAIREKEKDNESDFNALLAKQDYHNKYDLELLNRLKDEFIAEKEVSIDDVRQALETAEQFIKYLKDHKLI